MKHDFKIHPSLTDETTDRYINRYMQMTGGELNGASVDDFYKHLCAASYAINNEDAMEFLSKDVVDLDNYDIATKANSLTDETKSLANNSLELAVIMMLSDDNSGAGEAADQMRKMMSGEASGGTEKSEEEEQDESKSVLDGLSDVELNNILKDIALVKNLDIIQSSSRKTTKEDPSGKRIKYRRMSQYSDISRASHTDIAMPTYKLKMAKKELYVRKRVMTKSKSQGLLILLDDSASMKKGDKIQRVQGILAERMIECMKGNCDVYICKFTRHFRGSYEKLQTDTTFLDWFTRFGNFSGGATDIESCVKQSELDIRSGKLGNHEINSEHMEILVLNDGEDKIDINYQPDIRMNVLCLGVNNTDLMSISHRSGGRYMYQEINNLD